MILFSTLLVAFINPSVLGQKLENIRLTFHKIKSFEDAQKIIEAKEGTNTNTIQAYKGAAEVMQAQYVLSPLSKYNHFKKGSKKIDASISQNQNLENTYIRLIIQLNTPSFLGYNENIQKDIGYFCRNLAKSAISFDWKKRFIQSLLAAENSSVDLSKIKQIKLFENNSYKGYQHRS